MHDTISVPVFEAKNRLSALLAEVARGTGVVTTSRGVPVARLVPANTEAERRERARRAVEDLLGFPRDLPVRLDASTATQAWGATALLAERHRLRVYDAVHLELALRCDLSVAMLDKTRQRRPLGRGAGVGGCLAASTA